MFHEHTQAVFGQYSRRGGILDFFTPTEKDPVRIELWGDEIDSMANFSVQDQRRTQNLEKALVLPSAETLTSFRDGGREKLASDLERFA